MNDDTKLETILKASFHLQAQRITAMRMFTKAAIITRSVDSSQLSLAMNADVAVASNTKRIGWLLEQVTLSAADKQHFILGNQQSVRVSFDRTEWDFGSVTNNLLTAAVEVNGLAVPVHTKDLGGCGSSSDDARIRAVDDTLKVIPVSKIEVFTADREFASTRFIAYLLEKQIRFSIHLKCDALIEHDGLRLCGSAWFTAYQRKSLRNARVYGARVNACGRRMKVRAGEDAEYLIVVTNLEPLEGMRLYKTRWKIETLFGALKTRGFNLELTRFTQSKRLENLVLLLGVAVLWALRVGLWVSMRCKFRVRRDGTPFYSLFRVGLDFLRRLLMNPNPDLRVWDDAVHVLSST